MTKKNTKNPPKKVITKRNTGKDGKKVGTFAKGNEGGPGRVAGSVNKITVELKQGILQAAINRGRDGKGKDGLIGFLEYLSRVELKAFASLLGRLVPMHVIGNVDVMHGTMTKAQALEALRERGLPVFILPEHNIGGPVGQPAPVPGDGAKVIEGQVVPSQPASAPAQPVQAAPPKPAPAQPVAAASRFAGIAPPREAVKPKGTSH